MHVDVGVVAAYEGGVRDDHLAVLDDDRVLRELEAGPVPVRQEVVELEVGLPDLLDVACDDEFGDRLRILVRGSAELEAGRRHQ
jgi:hypothetical protein